MASVGRHTSTPVTNDASSGSGKARRALAEGVPCPASPRSSRRRRTSGRGTAGAHTQLGCRDPLARDTRRHEHGYAPRSRRARARIVEPGRAAAINPSPSVTDLVLLDGGERDRRMKRINALAFPGVEVAG
jgi:DNA polymerase-3 subunit epsilon